MLRLAEALPGGRRATIGALMAASYRGARDLYEIVSPEMEAMMDAMLSPPGVIGARRVRRLYGRARGC